MKSIVTALLLSVSFGALAANDIEMKVEAALSAESRPEAMRDRDDNRMPLETLNFFGLKDDMHVLELLPGGGWYTRVLAPILAENGKLYVALGSGRVEENLLGTPGFDAIQVLHTDDNTRRPEGASFYTLDDFDFGVSDLDMVLTFRNLHNFDPEARAVMNKQVFKALKSGGLYGVVDHTRRHMEAHDRENLVEALVVFGRLQFESSQMMMGDQFGHVLQPFPTGRLEPASHLTVQTGPL